MILKLSLKTSSLFAAIAISIYCVYTILNGAMNNPRYHHVFTSLYIDKFLTFQYNRMIWVTLMLVAIALLGVALFIHRKHIPQLSKSLLWQARIITTILSIYIIYNIARQTIGSSFESLTHLEYSLYVTDCVESTMMYNGGLMVWISIWLWQFAFLKPTNTFETNRLGISGILIAIGVGIILLLMFISFVHVMTTDRVIGFRTTIFISWIKPISALALLSVYLLEQRKIH